MSNKKGRIIVVSGPSGVGKSSLLKKLLEKYVDRLKFSVSHTSRLARAGEVDGVDYFFVSQDDFKRDIDRGVFIEWAVVHDNYYGTSQEMLDDFTSRGFDCILDIDVQGSQNLMNRGLDAIYIFIAPPSIDDLRERLYKRSTDADDVIAKRLKNAKKELEYKDKYPNIVVNDNFDRAFGEIEQIVYGAEVKK